MKKSSFVTIFIIFVIATVLLIIWSFGKDPTKIAEDNHVVTAETIEPLTTINPKETEAPSASPDETPAEETPSAPTVEPTPTPAAFPTIRNVDFVSYSNSFEYFSTYYKDKTATENAGVYMQEYTKNKLTGIDYVFKSCEESSESWDVCVTFTMHYEYNYTSKVLDLLKENNIKAMFFVSYQYITDNPELVKRMVNEGHIVGNRGKVVEESKIKQLTAEEFAESLLSVEREYQKLFGENARMYYYRTDYFSNRTLQVAQALGYTTVFRTYNYYQTYLTYGENITVADLAKRFNERGLYKGSVDEFVCEKKVYEALKTFIQYGLDENVSFKLVERKVFLNE